MFGLEGLDGLGEAVGLLEEEGQALGLVEGQLQVGGLRRQGRRGEGLDRAGQLQQGLVQGHLGRGQDVVLDGLLVTVAAVQVGAHLGQAVGLVAQGVGAEGHQLPRRVLGLGQQALVVHEAGPLPHQRGEQRPGVPLPQGEAEGEGHPVPGGQGAGDLGRVPQRDDLVGGLVLGPSEDGPPERQQQAHPGVLPDPSGAGEGLGVQGRRLGPPGAVGQADEGRGVDRGRGRPATAQVIEQAVVERRQTLDLPVPRGVGLAGPHEDVPARVEAEQVQDPGERGRPAAMHAQHEHAHAIARPSRRLRPTTRRASGARRASRRGR